MKTNGLRSLIYKAVLLILLSLYFLLVFSRTCDRHFDLPGNISYKKDTPPSLPKLLSFEGTSSNKQVRLTWEFETTEGLDECILERADKPGDFKPVAYFFMTEDIHIPNLRYTDNVPKNKTYFYRLRLKGKEGNNQYTKPLAFKINNKQNQKESLVYPFVIP
jgi:hypothetical protein